MLPRTLALTLFASSLLAADPEKLIKLRGSYESAMTKATVPIQKTYTTELEKLKIEFTKAGNLEAAIAVEAEIKRLTEEDGKQASELPGEKKDSINPAAANLADSMWLGIDGPLNGWTIQLGKDKNLKMVRSDGSPGWTGWSWNTNGEGKLLITVYATKPEEVTLSKKMDRITMKTWGTLKRQK